jgi:DNA (cytosine-5)-methyltransferase 1
MMENVPELAQDSRFTEFCESLENMGYIGNYKILNAAKYGVPQRRERLIYLAGLGTKIPFGRAKKRLNTVRNAISKLPKPGKSGDPLHDIPEHRTKAVMKKIRRIPHNGGSRTDLPLKDQLPCHKRCTGFKDVYGRMAWDEPAPTITGGCFNPSKGRFLHPEQNRAITMREAAILQGLPRRYKFRGTNNKGIIALMIGNALPPPLIRTHAYQVKKILMRA